MLYRTLRRTLRAEGRKAMAIGSLRPPTYSSAELCSAREISLWLLIKVELFVARDYIKSDVFSRARL